ncbi:MAG TPA: FAD/NAD(P)-binding protein [Trebonia sp.]
MVSEFDGLVNEGPSANGQILFDTACVLGGSVAGLLAARVLSDHARRVIVVERDPISAEPRSRPGTPHDQQVHTLLPEGNRWMARWFPGFTGDMRDLGATVAEADRAGAIFDGHPQALTGADYHLLLRPSTRRAGCRSPRPTRSRTSSGWSC